VQLPPPPLNYLFKNGLIFCSRVSFFSKESQLNVHATALFTLFISKRMLSYTFSAADCPGRHRGLTIFERTNSLSCYVHGSCFPRCNTAPTAQPSAVQVLACLCVILLTGSRLVILALRNTTSVDKSSFRIQAYMHITCSLTL
jgi:hypothetical protein